jgi:hypothetical protein
MNGDKDMDDRIVIITDGLKGLNNAAVGLVMKGEYDEAERMFETIENTSRTFRYGGGVGMARVSLANICVIRGRITGALDHMEVAVEHYPPGKERDDALIIQKKITLIALDIGIKKERSGDLNGALELFERIVGHLNEKRAVLVTKEIEHIRKHLNIQ